MSYIGDINLGDTIDVKFTTVGTTGAPTTLAGSPVVSAYPDNSTTEITAGITLSVDFDSRTGMHNVRVVASSGNGYAAASNYALVLTAGTVGGTSVVGYVIGEFSIQARSALRPATAGRTLVVDAAGLADANAVKLGPTGSGTAQTARDIGGSVLLSAGTGAGQLDFTSGVLKANAVQWLGGTIPAVNVTGVPLVDVKYHLGTIFATPATAGIPDINVKNINNVAAATPGAAGGVFIAGSNAATTVNFTGNLSGSVGSVTGLTVPSNFSSLSIDASGRVKSQTSVSKNTALSGFVFVMTDSTTHAPKTGVTVSATRSLDGAAYAACTNAPTEIANGAYKIDLSAADMNANTVTLRFTGTAADDLVIEILTTP